MMSYRIPVAVAAIGLAFACQSEPQVRLGPADGHDLPAIDLERIQVGDVAPDFTLPAFSGDTISLSDYRGNKIVVLQFYRGHW